MRVNVTVPTGTPEPPAAPPVKTAPKKAEKKEQADV